MNAAGCKVSGIFIIHLKQDLLYRTDVCLASELQRYTNLGLQLNRWLNCILYATSCFLYEMYIHFIEWSTTQKQTHQLKTKSVFLCNLSILLTNNWEYCNILARTWTLLGIFVSISSLYKLSSQYGIWSDYLYTFQLWRLLEDTKIILKVEFLIIMQYIMQKQQHNV